MLCLRGKDTNISGWGPREWSSEENYSRLQMDIPSSEILEVGYTRNAWEDDVCEETYNGAHSYQPAIFNFFESVPLTK